MAKKILDLKENGGRFFYRRRAPNRHHKTLGFTMWNRPCGDVSYQKADTLAYARDGMPWVDQNPERGVGRACAS